jgi:drug/metabolite transporter (DMT)-like permease
MIQTDTIARRNTMIGIASVLGASCLFSINDVCFKFLSGGYALHQLVLIRSLIGLVVLMAVIVPFQGGLGVLRTRRMGMHLLRGACVVFANFCFFLGLAALPLADAVAISFVSPLLITAMSVVFLGETVGPRRWLAVGMGLLGVIIMVRPGTSAFQLAALLPLASAFGYAFLQILTRKIRLTERAITMSIYIQITFVMASGAIGLALGDGHLAAQADPSLAFLLRDWVWPAAQDWPILLLIGAGSALGGFLISQGYSLCDAGLAAPFEYIAMPLAIIWGVTVFGDWPDTTGFVGMALICAGGLYMLWRETTLGRPAVGSRPFRRR